MDFFNVLKLCGFPVTKASAMFHEIKAQSGRPQWMENQKWSSFDFHYYNNKSYRDFVGSYPGSWEDIPVLNKSHFKEHGITKMPDQNLSPRYYKKQTSGSSGKPFIFYTDYLNHTLTWLLMADRYHSAGVALNNVQARFYGTPYSFTSRVIERAKDILTNRVRFNIFDLSDDNMERWLKLFAAREFKYIYGYSYPIICLSKYLTERGMILKAITPQLVSCIVTSEMCSPVEQVQAENAFGVPVYNEYGSSETGIIGFGRDNKWKLSNELTFTEIVDDNNKTCRDTETGNVVVTSLFNRGTPLIRYNLGDNASITTSWGERSLTGLQGRVEEVAILGSGKRIAGDSTFLYVFKEFTRHCKVVNEYKVTQASPTKFDINLIASRDLTGKEENELRKIATVFLEPGVNINIERKHQLERTPLGKFKRFERLFN